MNPQEDSEMQDTVSKDRQKYIGGSDIPVIMELSPFKSRFDLLLEKAGLKDDKFTGNVFTEYGNIMEAKIRDFINEVTGNTFTEGKHIGSIPKDWNVKSKGMKIRCHTDGEIPNSILEIKTTSQIHESLDDYQIYLVQLLFYMMMTHSEEGILAVYKRPDDMSEEFDEENLRLYIINISNHIDLINSIKNAVIRFLDDLQKVKSNPFITEEELLPAEIPDITARIVAFEQQLAYMKEIEKKVKAEKDRLKEAMETAGVKKWETPNGYKITLIPDSEDKAEKEESFNAERFMADHPELVEQYTEIKTVIKKGKKGYVRITSPKESK